MGPASLSVRVALRLITRSRASTSLNCTNSLQHQSTKTPIWKPRISSRTPMFQFYHTQQPREPLCRATTAARCHTMTWVPEHAEFALSRAADPSARSKRRATAAPPRRTRLFAQAEYRPRAGPPSPCAAETNVAGPRPTSRTKVRHEERPDRGHMLTVLLGSSHFRPRFSLAHSIDPRASPAPPASAKAEELAASPSPEASPSGCRWARHGAETAEAPQARPWPVYFIEARRLNGRPRSARNGAPPSDAHCYEVRTVLPRPVGRHRRNLIIEDRAEASINKNCASRRGTKRLVA